MKSKLLKRALSLSISAALSVSALTIGGISTATAAETDNYAKLLQYSLYFYDCNMCGKSVESKGAIQWRGNCHTDDEVEGGFHDAGDHAVFGLPQGYAASTLGWAYHAFPDAFEKTGQTDHLKTITDYFCDFIRRSAQMNGDTISRFLYQKGDGNEDHGYWGAPEKQGGGRKMFWTSDTGGDIAAEYAAALAANYVNFGNPADLTYAKAYYKYSTAHGSAATDGPTGFYDSKSVNDDQAWAAGWLYLATKDDYYLGELRSKKPAVYWVHSWNDVHLGANCLYGEITGDWSGATSYIGSEANGSGFKVLTEWGSARYNCSLQMCALIAEKNGKGSYKDWCKGQMTQILGQNPKNICLVTGFASNSAKNTHHRAASGYQGYSDGMGEGTTQYHPTNGKVLVGALAGGPADAGWTYSDVINDYKCNEVAIDYNAGLVGAAAGLYSMYKTGSTDTSIVGVTKIYNGNGNDQPQQTTAPVVTPNPTYTTTPKPAEGAEQNAQISGEDGKYQISVANASKLTLTLKTNSNDTEANGCFGYSAGDWKEVQWKASPNGGTYTVEFDVPDGVSSVQFQVWWPTSSTIEKAVLTMKPGSYGSDYSQPIQSIVTTTTPKPIVTTTPKKDDPKRGLPGDANCDNDLSLTDAVLVARSIAGMGTNLSTQGMLNADVDGTQGLGDGDLVMILKAIAGAITLS